MHDVEIKKKGEFRNTGFTKANQNAEESPQSMLLYAERCSVMNWTDIPKQSDPSISAKEYVFVCVVLELFVSCLC